MRNRHATIDLRIAFCLTIAMSAASAARIRLLNAAPDRGVAHRAMPIAALTGPQVISHPENVQPGLPLEHPLQSVRNPREGDPNAVAQGAKLFVAYNCADCHGAGGSGAMGPALNDGRWHFGGSAAEVYESIAEGRPDGMPSWGGRLPDDQIWALVSYVRSLTPTADVSTDNFEGETVERTGH
ncbi:MAG TPA: c-type cytochrome [Gemmatimonadaceae bacterium]|nr:c-type cytochrome [Gemmatimonadaceae bacterium]